VERYSRKYAKDVGLEFRLEKRRSRRKENFWGNTTPANCVGEGMAATGKKGPKLQPNLEEEMRLNRTVTKFKQGDVQPESGRSELVFVWGKKPSR